MVKTSASLSGTEFESQLSQNENITCFHGIEKYREEICMPKSSQRDVKSTNPFWANVVDNGLNPTLWYQYLSTAASAWNSVIPHDKDIRT
ncbi:jg12328 [Pararge aegeria aegeria]|uniref:Jg12328 protein n=1 Tax=Pararge aegeria aegeria TaxID=348720 RepID=A0A8S4R8E5_9NEOP|nr:jg12328 [Pararge aegeria aegeria]